MKNHRLLFMILAFVLGLSLMQLSANSQSWAMTQVQLHEEQTNYAETEVDVALLTAVVFPFVFALVELLASRLVDPHPRQGDQKFRISFLEGGTEFKKYPFDMNTLRKELRKKKEFLDIEVMAPGFLETNIGIDLCVGAIAANIANVLIMLLSPDVVRTISLRIVAMSAFGVELALLFIVINMLRIWGNHRELWKRIGVAQFSNVSGVALLVVQFFIFGEVLVP